MNTIPCKSCCEEISVSASRCPKCQSYQTVFRNPQFIAFFVAVPMAFLPLYFMKDLVFPDKFVDHSDQIVVEVTDTDYNENGMGGSQIIIMGEIANTSDVKWDSVVFEILVDDANNKRIDVIQEQDYDVVLVPNQNNEFRLKVDSVAPPGLIKKIQVRIKDAGVSRF